jgi:hypothetical protein
MHGTTSSSFPIKAPEKQLIRAHRIRIADIPALFSEGAEPEALYLERQSWLQRVSRKLARTFAGHMPNLLPAQARNEETVRSAAMRRQTQAQA